MEIKESNYVCKYLYKQLGITKPCMYSEQFRGKYCLVPCNPPKIQHIKE